MINGSDPRQNPAEGNGELNGGRFPVTWLLAVAVLGIGIWLSGLYSPAEKATRSSSQQAERRGTKPTAPKENSPPTEQQNVVHPTSLPPSRTLPTTGAPNFPAVAPPVRKPKESGQGQIVSQETQRHPFVIRGGMPQQMPKTGRTSAHDIEPNLTPGSVLKGSYEPGFRKNLFPPSTPEPPLAQARTGVPSFPRMAHPMQPLGGSGVVQVGGHTGGGQLQLVGGKDNQQEPQKPGVLPFPKTGPFEPFGPTRPRLPSLLAPGISRGCDGQNPCVERPSKASRPVPTPEELKAFQANIQGVIDPQNTLDLYVGRTRVVLLKNAPTRVQIADEQIAVANPLEPLNLAVLGRKVGTTVLNLWFDNPKDKKKPIILSYLVRVFPDPLAKTRLDQIYDQLAKEINCAFPDSYVKLRLVGDKLVAKGEVKDIAEGFQILRILRANAPPEGKEQVPVDTVNVVLPPGDPTGLSNPPTLDDFLTFGGPNVVNLLRVAGEQQVMLKVTVAEVNRAAARSIGLNFSITNSDGMAVFQNLTGNIASGGLAPGLGALAGVTTGAVNNGPVNNLPVSLDNGQVSLAINALKNLSYARSLAEPNLTTMNGQTATFLAGGQFPVPVTTGVGIGALQGVSFVPFGVQLAFTPYITDRNRIRLILSATVSTRDLSSSSNIGGAVVSGLNTRTFTSTVQLRDGETLAVAGLIQNNLGAESERIPFLGDLPILTNLTGSNRTSSGEQELVVLVQPVLVRPLRHGKLPPLPGSDVFEPSDLEFYLLGRLESRRRYDYRASAMTDFHRMQAYHRCERYYIFGPHGHATPGFVADHGAHEGVPLEVAGQGQPLLPNGGMPGEGTLLPNGTVPQGQPPEQLPLPNQLPQLLPQGSRRPISPQSGVVRGGVAQTHYWQHTHRPEGLQTRRTDRVRGGTSYQPYGYAPRTPSVSAPSRPRPLIRFSRWLWGFSD